MNNVEMHKELCNDIHETYKSKNSDYGNSFSDTYAKLGIISALTRISDKYNRLVSLCTKPENERKVLDESISDTLLDMANYCIMTVMELESEKNKEIDLKLEKTKELNKEINDWYNSIKCTKPDLMLY